MRGHRLSVVHHRVFGNASKPLSFRDETKDEPAVNKFVLARTFPFLAEPFGHSRTCRFSRCTACVLILFSERAALCSISFNRDSRPFCILTSRPRIRCSELLLKMNQCTCCQVCNCTILMFRWLFLPRQHEWECQYILGTRIVCLLSPEATSFNIPTECFVFPKKWLEELIGMSPWLRQASISYVQMQLNRWSMRAMPDHLVPLPNTGTRFAKLHINTAFLSFAFETFMV